MPEDCSEYYLAILPGTAGKNLPIDDTENMLTIFEQYGTLYDKDLKSEPIDDFGDFMLLDDCDYTILSLPFDAEGNKGVAERLNFTTPRRPLAGTPDINAEVLESAPFYFVTRFTPNDDCKEIAICIFEKGTAEQQFEMYGAMMGLYSMKHMVDQFSGPRISGASTDTVPRSKDLIPNTEYELYVLTVDKNGVYGDMKIFPMTTAILGGSGEAKCTIEIGEGSYSADNGVCQMVTVTPNDQAGMYHYILIDKDTFDLPKWQESGVTEYLKATQEGNPYWDLYTTDVWNW